MKSALAEQVLPNKQCIVSNFPFTIRWKIFCCETKDYVGDSCVTTTTGHVGHVTRGYVTLVLMSRKELCDIRDLQGKELNWFVYIFILELLKKDKKVKQMPVWAEVGTFHPTFILSEYSGHVWWVIAGGRGDIFLFLLYFYSLLFWVDILAMSGE